VETLRVEAARVKMEQGRHAKDIVANETGFAHRERMRRAFPQPMGSRPRQCAAMRATVSRLHGFRDRARRRALGRRAGSD
jgi:transcriptional regulator GlxA family with amidase domain